MRGMKIVRIESRFRIPFAILALAPTVGWLAGCEDASRSVAPAQSPEASAYSPPADIDATGVADVTEELNRFFESVPQNATVRFPAGAQYRMEGMLILKDRHGLTIDGNGARLFATTDGSSTTPVESYGFLWPRSRQHVLFEGGSDIVVRDLTIVGAHPNAGSAQGAYIAALEGQHGFKFAGVDGAELVRVRVTDVYGDFIYLGARAGTWSRDIHVSDSFFERNGRQGIAITAAEDVLIERSHIGEVARSIIDLEPNSPAGGARRVTFSDNTFGLCRHLFLAAGGAGGNVGDVEFSGNRLVGMKLKVEVGAADGSRRGPFRFLDNVSDSPHGALAPMMRFFRVDGILVQANTQPMVPEREMTAVQAVESCDIHVSDNDFPGAAQILSADAFSCPVSGNSNAPLSSPS